MITLFMMNVQARSTSSLGPSALPHVNEFIKFLELLLLAAPYSIAPLALTDGLWSLTCSFFIIFCLFEKKKGGHLLMIPRAAIIKCLNT